LTFAALGRLQSGRFYFCDQPGCDILYFSDAGQTFQVRDVHVAVWQKQRPGARRLCYCFGENEQDMQREIETHGRTQAIERVRHHMANGRCACDVRNPRGVCCLGDLMAAIARLRAREITP